MVNDGQRLPKQYISMDFIIIPIIFSLAKHKLMVQFRYTLAVPDYLY